MAAAKSRRGQPALALLAATAGLVASGAGAAHAASLRLGGGPTERVQMCGGVHRAVVVDDGQRVVARSSSPVWAIVESCSDGRWLDPQSLRVGRRSASVDTSTTGDYRVRPRSAAASGSARYLRVGVGEIADLRVSFPVANTNGSKTPCLTDGKSYAISGELVAPRALLAGERRAVTVYLHGVEITDGYFHVPVAGYDFVTELARLGHASLIVDRLGFGASGRPDGTQACVGGDADITHQIIGMLRAGTYEIAGDGAPSFDRIAVAGHSGGNPIAESEAYSYHDADALIVMGWQDGGATPPLLEAAAEGEAATCAAGGQRTDGPQAPAGYAYLWPSERQWAHDTTYDIEPRVLSAMARFRRRTPCEELESDVIESSLARNYLGSVTTPVLLMYADHDILFPASSGPGQRDLFTGSHDVTLATFAGAGHVFFIERIAPKVRATLSDWLTRHRL